MSLSWKPPDAPPVVSVSAVKSRLLEEVVSVRVRQESQTANANNVHPAKFHLLAFALKLDGPENLKTITSRRRMRSTFDHGRARISLVIIAIRDI